LGGERGPPLPRSLTEVDNGFGRRAHVRFGSQPVYPNIGQNLLQVIIQQVKEIFKSWKRTPDQKQTSRCWNLKPVVLFFVGVFVT